MSTESPEPAESPEPSTTSRRNRLLIIWGGVGVVVGIALVAVFLWWFFKDDAPPAVDIDDAAAQVADAADDGAEGVDGTAPPADGTSPPADSTDPPADGTAPPADGTADTAPVTTPDTTSDDAASGAGSAATAVDGTWSVDTSIGEFSFEDSTGTFVGFRVEEELAAIGSATAVGRTPVVSGTIEIEGTTVTDVQIEADLSEITTNDSRRDRRVQEALETGQFPTATFRTTESIELGEEALAGEQVSVSAVGELTIHGVTLPVTIPLDAQLVDDTIVVVGSVDIVFGDYGVAVPSAPIVLSAADNGPLELQLFFTR